MTQSTTPKTPGVPATMSTVWPPSNPSGTVIPFPLPWGQTGCCPPGGMSALMQCYCDLQQASAFIGQVMLDQINNNPAIIQAIIAGIEASGSSLPLIGVTNGSDAQPGQVGEFVEFQVTQAFTGAAQTLNVSFGVLQPGDWDCAAWLSELTSSVSSFVFQLVPPIPPGFSNSMETGFVADGPAEIVNIIAVSRASLSVPTLVPMVLQINTLGAATTTGTLGMVFQARRAR